ncbi:MAG: PEP-CTERM sorting domain-containing protein [Spirulinaceae cyanobacterium SM2_1_0]|nr:PEP-CTERM sorting domain-containing protein [Spirulinaceae cyanobacterium SM2_1_0]
MKNFASQLAIFGTAAIATSTVWSFARPAQANMLTFDYDALITGEVDFNNTALLAIEQLLAVDLDDPTALNKSLSGSFTTLSDPNQYLDGDLELGRDFLTSLFGVDPSFLDPFDALLDLDLSGTGTLATTGGDLDFTIGYDSLLDTLLFSFDAANASLIDNCLVGTCIADAMLDLTILLAGPDTEVASGSLTLLAEIEPRAASVPEPSAVLGFLAAAGVFATTRRRAA